MTSVLSFLNAPSTASETHLAIDFKYSMLLFSQCLVSENLRVLEQLLGPFWDLGILPLLPLAEEMYFFFCFFWGVFFVGGGGGLILHENQAGT